jgi:hypothetical protein
MTSIAIENSKRNVPARADIDPAELGRLLVPLWDGVIPGVPSAPGASAAKIADQTFDLSQDRKARRKILCRRQPS